MNYVAWLVVGAALGWLSVWAAPRRAPQLPTAYSVLVGAAGGFVGGLALTPLVGLDVPAESVWTLKVPALLVALASAGLLLAAVNYAHRR